MHTALLRLSVVPGIWFCYGAGVCLFLLFLFPLTSPTLYSSALWPADGLSTTRSGMATVRYDKRNHVWTWSGIRLVVKQLVELLHMCVSSPIRRSIGSCWHGGNGLSTFVGCSERSSAIRRQLYAPKPADEDFGDYVPPTMLVNSELTIPRNPYHGSPCPWGCTLACHVFIPEYRDVLLWARFIIKVHVARSWRLVVRDTFEIIINLIAKSPRSSYLGVWEFVHDICAHCLGVGVGWLSDFSILTTASDRWSVMSCFL